MDQERFIQFRNISKSFPGVKALSDVSFSIRKGEIHAICGENGAGKSTLINICSGVFQQNHGQMLIAGNQVKFSSPKDAELYNIATVFQEVPLCENMTIADNIFLGPRLKSTFGFLNRKFIHAKTKELLNEFDMYYPPDMHIERLSVVDKSLVQFMRAIYTDPDILILDEPTSSLPVEKKDLIFSFLRKKRKEKEITVLYISHKFEEVFEISDRISVLRDGAYVGTVDTLKADIDTIIKMMVGRSVDKYIYDKSKNENEIVFEIKNLYCKHVLNDISFSIKKGEILGFAGLQGAGRTELARAIFGIDKPDAAEKFINGKKVKVNNPHQAIKNGIAMIPENRRDEGIVPVMTVSDNMVMVALKKISAFGFIKNKLKNRIIQAYTDSLGIKISSPRQVIAELSGGNQQKVIISRWLANEPDVLICDEPTRGIDVNTKAEIHKILVNLASDGMAIILISSELPDLLTICDRIIIMKEGRIKGELMHEDATEEKIMYLATSN